MIFGETQVSKSIWKMKKVVIVYLTDGKKVYTMKCVKRREVEWKMEDFDEKKK
jgi:hypothetical protein